MLNMNCTTYSKQHRSKEVQPNGSPWRTITVALDMSKAFDTINIRTLIRKLLQTKIPGTIIKFTANYIKGRKDYTTYGNHTSSIQNWRSIRWRPFTNTIQHLHCRPTTTQSTGSGNGLRRRHHKSHPHTQVRVQPRNTYNHTSTKQNNLLLNPDKTTCTLFTPDPAEYKGNLNLTINNKALPMAMHPRVLGLTLDPKLTCSTHIHTISIQPHKPLQIINALTATGRVNRRIHSWLPIKQLWDRLWSMPLLYGRLLHPRPTLTNCKSCRPQHWELPQDANKTQIYNICMTKHSHSPYTSTYSSTPYKANRKHNIHHIPYPNTQHTSTLQG